MILAIIQIIVSVALMVLVLLQERSAGLSGIFGGGDGGGGFYQTRRGVEKAVFVSTIVLAIVFCGLAILQLVYRG
ncbi:MAG: preprotein translocase subunit SecG [Candidatus Ryanbacteria bacterium RIFCSPLOWO2_01_FULL_48_26]|uniref:Protein-export membrane protein SecG n=1 Tax=Candidatus Ryanbacteria bacterium RIFCSPLOWO2_01_FULL_48_26 TaxID=1802126 RepID=A0A1G2GS48_9BACT|nr:MAG: preprotein translocase subunit SecG [Candidatus Ryanbacteria bacterium RIFCSPLOWO2_01_FULL_48_26]